MVIGDLGGGAVNAPNADIGHLAIEGQHVAGVESADEGSAIGDVRRNRRRCALNGAVDIQLSIGSVERHGNMMPRAVGEILDADRPAASQQPVLQKTGVGAKEK